MLAPGEAQPSLGQTRELAQVSLQSRRQSFSMSCTNLLYHIVYATKERAPLITKALRHRLHEYLGGTVRGTWFRRGKLQMTQPTVIFFGPDGGSRSSFDWEPSQQAYLSLIESRSPERLQQFLVDLHGH